MRTVVLLLVALMLGLSGCGGGGGGGPTGPTTVDHPTFQISWPERTRAGITHNLTSAQSATVTLVHADPSGNDVTVNVERDPAKQEAYTGTYTVPQAVVTTFTAMTATFYAEPSEAGPVVGTATVSVTVVDGKLNLGSVNVVGTVKSVQVVAAGPLKVGDEALQLHASAMDSENHTVAVTPGSVKWAVTSGGANLTVTEDGMATAVAAGTATVTATIDGVASAPSTITVKAADIGGATFKIAWPARTREALAHGLTSALSAKVTLKNASVGGEDVNLTVNRDAAQTAAHTETYSVGQTVSGTVSVLTATFYAQADGTGDVVGSATAAIEPNGNSLELVSVVVAGTVKTVTVVTPGEIMVGGNTVQLQATAKDAASNVVAVTPGSIKWNVVSGETRLSVTNDGIATGLAGGTAKVTATIDGVVSANKTITVSTPGPAVQTIDLPVLEMTFDPVSGKIWATVQSTGGTYANSVVSIDPATGAIGDKISVGAEPNQITVTDDGQFAYVSVNADSTVRRVDLATHSVVATYAVNIGGAAVDLKAVPGSPHSFAVCTDPTFGVNLSVWDDGVRRNNTGAAGYAIHFASPTLIYGDGGNSLFEDVLTPTEVQWTGQTGLDVGGFTYAGGLLYTAKGLVIDPVAKTVVLQYPQTHFLFDKGSTVNLADNRTYFVTWDFSIPKHILTFNRTTGEELTLTDTGISEGGAENLIACGNHTVAFHLFGSGVKRKPVIVRGLP